MKSSIDSRRATIWLEVFLGVADVSQLSIPHRRHPITYERAYDRRKYDDTTSVRQTSVDQITHTQTSKDANIYQESLSIICLR